jgi:hypothetical protein
VDHVVKDRFPWWVSVDSADNFGFRKEGMSGPVERLSASAIGHYSTEQTSNFSLHFFAIK